MQKVKSEFRQMRQVATLIEQALRTIEAYCKERHMRCGFDTPIPFGIGVDVFLLPAYTLISEYFPKMYNAKWFKDAFSSLKTVGDIVDFQRTVLEKARK